MPRKKYPSDHRRWFRLYSADLEADTAHLTDAEFRAFILLLARANEQRAQDRGDHVHISRGALVSVSPNRRDSSATSARVVRELCASQAWEMREEGASVTIFVRNWSEFQGFTPTKLRRDSDETPGTTPTPTPTPSKKESRAPARSPVCDFPWPFPEGDAARLERWWTRVETAGASPGVIAAQVLHAIATVRDWAVSNGKRKRDWVATIRNAMRAGWALKGFKPPPGATPSQRGNGRAAELYANSPAWCRAQSPPIDPLEYGHNGACGDDCSRRHA